MGQKTTRRALLILSLMIIGAAILSVPALAHHGTGISYDQDTQITLNGTIKEFVWRNPHAQLWVDIAEGEFKGQSYGIEMNSPGVMLRWGWSKNTFKPGDEITVKVHPSKTGRAVGECLNCVVDIKGKGTVKPTDNAGNQ
ncbi:MAG: hypothetical protein DMG11_28985 [Acidobacteria bacterium]|nr:MAG: hypothetical protein DMG11_28985 [Acidobacteriota bacterium]